MTDDRQQTSPSKDAKLRPTVDGRRITAGAATYDDFTYSIVETRTITKRPATTVKPTTKGAIGERRGEERQRTRLRDGVLAEARGRVVGDCRIRDRSKRGARLQLDADTPLPRMFLLADPASRTRFRATLIWQDGRDAGVRLTAVD